ncbi:uncharacterized protein LOC119464274 [Dermacentor silvarum]|uniref:uncharacterized protein LOC119464274 n=1 Tax=Dermacentor silvarum TaxID=543639 RepID=UPI0018980CAD|nr:uncharacterized protein LOC119464274 [Dermacentor silvarum]
MTTRKSILLATAAVYAFCFCPNLTHAQYYPELRFDLQKYQDPMACPARAGEWHMVYRNYPYDPFYGGVAKCVSFQRLGPVKDFTFPAKFSWRSDGAGTQSVVGTYVFSSTPGYTARNLHTFLPKNAPFAWQKHTLYVDCGNCYISRHHYAGNGCTLWRRARNVPGKGTDHCDFIFDLVCGSFPKYVVYEPSCPVDLGPGPEKALEVTSG